MELRLPVSGLCVLLALITIVSTGREWIPQLGTVTFPKTPGFSKIVNKGQFYRVHDEIYVALEDFQLTGKSMGSIDFLSEFQKKWLRMSNKVKYPETFQIFGRKVDQGTYMLPKLFDAHDTCEHGDIFLDEESHLYYRVNIQSGTVGECEWNFVDETENWMGLLRPLIGDTRLGDLMIPGTHDSGTYGITSESMLIDRNFLFQIADRVEPQVLANWSLTQTEDFDHQLRMGFRSFDMRIADTNVYDGLFRWWHGLSADEISDGLYQIGQFARDHPEEVIILSFSHFAAPGTILDGTLPIPNERKDIISDMLLAYLGDEMTFSSGLTINPTVNEVLSTGRNIILVMGDPYIRAKDDRYWEDVIHDPFTGRTNPEDYCGHRSGLLEDYKQSYSNHMTYISGALTPNEKIIIAGLLNFYGHNETILDIVDDIVPGLRNISTHNMSFEGLWVDLLNMARYGANSFGMYMRPEDLYTNGASIHFLGINDQIRHWLARPGLYKLNSIGVDDALSSAAVSLAIQANRGDIVREVTIAHQGSPKTGFYEWDESDFGTIGGTDGIGCSSVISRYLVKLQGVVLDYGSLDERGSVDIQEGFYPDGSHVEVEVSTEGSTWRTLFSGGIQPMIETNSDVYIRGRGYEDGTGFAYASTTYGDYGVACDLPPANMDNVLQIVTW